nr:MAG TPA: Regulatory protein-modification, helix-turn-helix, transcriptional regulator, DNA [Caudoviricetes sp.]
MFNKARFDLILALTGDKMMDAAEVMEISTTSLYNKRQGKHDFTRREIEAFCRHYMVSPMDVFFEGLEDDLRRAKGAKA